MPCADVCHYVVCATIVFLVDQSSVGILPLNLAIHSVGGNFLYLTAVFLKIRCSLP